MKDQHQLYSYLDKVIHYGNVVVKVALFATIVSLLISMILVVTVGDVDGDRPVKWYAQLIWPLLLGSMWVLIYAPIYLVTTAIYNRYFRKSPYASLRPQLRLLLVTITTALIFVTIAMWVSTTG